MELLARLRAQRVRAEQALAPDRLVGRTRCQLRHHQDLAGMAVTVTEAERVLGGYASRIETLNAQGQCGRRMGVLLRLVEARLEQLYRSRHVLLDDDER